jgi:hypothetical protein
MRLAACLEAHREDAHRGVSTSNPENGRRRPQFFEKKNEIGILRQHNGLGISRSFEDLPIARFG